jgi:hypothetical protein
MRKKVDIRVEIVEDIFAAAEIKVDNGEKLFNIRV